MSKVEQLRTRTDSPKVVKINVRTVRRVLGGFSADRIKTDRRKPIKAQETISGTLGKPTLQKNIFKHNGKRKTPSFDLSELEVHESVCLNGRDLTLKPRQGKETYKAKQNVFKLLRAARVSKSTTLQPILIGKEAPSLVSILREASEVVDSTFKMKPLTKQIRSTSHTSTILKRETISTCKEFDSCLRPEGAEGRLMYSIKNKELLQQTEHEAKNYTEIAHGRKERKSRAERMWMWKGKRGVLDRL